MTATQIPSKARRGRHKAPSGARSYDPRLIALALAGLAVGIFILAIPRVLAQSMLLPIRPLLELMYRGEVLDVQQQAEAYQALRSARRFQKDDASIAIALGLLGFNELRRDGLNSPRGKMALLSGIENLQAGLALAPADSFAWALLAQGRTARDGSLSDSSKAALNMSYDMGPFDHGAMLVRSETTLSNWQELGDELTLLARREILNLWQRSWDDQKKLIALACRHNAVFALSEALRTDPSARKDFDNFYKPYLSPEGCKTSP